MKRIESADLERLGASAKALDYYNGTTPLDIWQNPDGTFTVRECGDSRTYADAAEMLAAFEELRDQWDDIEEPAGVYVPMTDYEIQESALALQAGGWTGDDEEQFLEDNATRPEDEQASAADIERIFDAIRALEKSE